MIHLETTKTKTNLLPKFLYWFIYYYMSWLYNLSDRCRLDRWSVSSTWKVLVFLYHQLKLLIYFYTEWLTKDILYYKYKYILLLGWLWRLFQFYMYVSQTLRYYCVPLLPDRCDTLWKGNKNPARGLSLWHTTRGWGGKQPISTE